MKFAVLTRARRVPKILIAAIGRLRVPIAQASTNQQTSQISRGKFGGNDGIDVRN